MTNIIDHPTASQPTCPPWCVDHKILADDPSQVIERVESHRAEAFWLRSTEDSPYSIAVMVSQLLADGRPYGDPSIALQTHPQSESTIPIGLSVRQARLVAEALLRFVEMG
jgi:hypothetical protein